MNEFNFKENKNGDVHEHKYFLCDCEIERERRRMMGKVNFDLPDLISKNLPCKDLVTNVKVAAAYILGFFAVVFLSNIARALLRSYQQPRMVAETLVS